MRREGLPRGTLDLIVPIYPCPAFPSTGIWVSKLSSGALIASMGRNTARPRWKNIFVNGSQCYSHLSSRY